MRSVRTHVSWWSGAESTMATGLLIPTQPEFTEPLISKPDFLNLNSLVNYLENLTSCPELSVGLDIRLLGVALLLINCLSLQDF